MSRRGSVDKRELVPDSKYHSLLLAKFINMLMKNGKKALAENIVYGALAKAENQLQLNGLEIFNKAVENVKPAVELCYRRVGGATYPVPIEARPVRAKSLAMRWLFIAAEKRARKSMCIKLYEEFVDAYGNRGGAVKKREENHKMTEANKAFAHFRW
jgi:small subunit ribosomal protein S7